MNKRLQGTMSTPPTNFTRGNCIVRNHSPKERKITWKNCARGEHMCWFYDVIFLEINNTDWIKQRELIYTLMLLHAR